VLAIIMGGFGGLGLALFIEYYLDDSLGKPEDVEKSLQLPVLASIPQLAMSDTKPHRPRLAVVTLKETSLNLQKVIAAKVARQVPKQAPSNRYREIKSKLITRFPERSIKTIMFTSTAHGDGSSFTAVSFATSLAKDCLLNVLLIDANLRSPRFHEVFNIHQNNGLSAILNKGEDEKCFVRKVGYGNLYVIPCRGNNIGPLNLFESIRFEKMLQIMREKFDYVILDTPPVNKYEDPVVIASKVDGVILVIEADKTRKQVAIQAKQEMEKAGAKVLGVILNRRKHYIPEWIYKRL
jgi:capsular exopolysaccharide synthesis family protein